MELDLQKIAVLAEQRKEENLQFRAQLRTMDPEMLDEKVHVLNQEVSSAIDCTTCGNCCRTFIVSLDQEDKTRLCTHLEMDPESFTRDYLEKSQQGEYIFSHIPCRFLKDNRCTVYGVRPEDCRSYPHLHKKDVSLHLMALLGSYGVCPIVFNVLEKLKADTGFQE